MVGLEPGSIFAGRYRIIRSLGAGGMGAVYLASDPSDPEFLVALKLLYPGAMESQQARERFRNEITASYKINHHNVVKAYEYFDAEDLQAYAMEYIDGGDLMDRMLDGPISADEAVRIIKQIASALDAIHAAGIIHRDLKPENILMTKRGEVKISDFGVARLRDAQTLTQAGSMVGTPKYLAPEYVETGECDQRGDIFALGVIGYEMLSGKSPFGKAVGPDKVLDRLTTRIEPLDQIAPNCPASLARIIEKAMSMRLSKRHASAAALLEDLCAYENGELQDQLDQTAPSSETELKYSTRFEQSEYPSSEPESNSPQIEQAHSDFEDSNDNHATVTSAFDSTLDLLYHYLRLPFKGAVAILSLILLIGFSSQVFFGSNYTLKSLPNGQYIGSVSGVMGTDSDYPFVVVRRGGNSWIILGKQSCAASPVDSSGTFSCGDLHFEINVTSVANKKAVGTIKELSWGTVGIWNLEEQR